MPTHDSMRRTPLMEPNRPVMERLQVIHDQLSRKRYPNCSKLAEALEVTPRTIHRYLDFMRDRLNLPVRFDHARNGYCYTKEVGRLPIAPQAVSEAELTAMLVAAKALEPYRGTPWRDPLRRVFKKMAGSLDAGTRIQLRDAEVAVDIRLTGPDELDASVFDTVNEAIQQGRTLAFSYRKHMGRTFEGRRIHPYQVACVANRWYLIGHDLERDAIRVFVVSRIQDPHLLEGAFTRPRDFNSEEYLRKSFGIFRGAGDHEVVIDLDAWASDVFRGRRWHASQQVTARRNGRLRVTFRLDNLEEIEPWVLSWGRHATVVRPAQLAERIKAAAASLLQRYGSGS